MEKNHLGIYLKNCFMKKIFAVAASLILVVVSANSQSEKKEPPPPPPPPKKIDIVIAKGEKADAFYKQHPSVTEISSQGNTLMLKKTDGATEKYDMSKKEEHKRFTKTYGSSPIPPPVIVIKKSTPPIITVEGKRADEFYNRNPSVAEISRQGNIIMLKMKDGSTEKYDMSNREEDKSFTEKYGVSPIPPPAPPPKLKSKA